MSEHQDDRSDEPRLSGRRERWTDQTKKREEIEEFARLLGEDPHRTDDDKLRCINCFQPLPEVRHSPVYCEACGVGPLCEDCYWAHYDEAHPEGEQQPAAASPAARPAAAPLASAAARPNAELREAPWRQRRLRRRAAWGAGLGLTAVVAAGAVWWTLGTAGPPSAGSGAAAAIGAAAGEDPGEPIAVDAPAGELGVRILDFTRETAQGGDASLSVATTPGASCSIEVRYKSGPSQSRDLEPKTAGLDGRVAWSWRINARTAAGEWPVTVRCADGDAEGAATTSLTVTPRESP